MAPRTSEWKTAPKDLVKVIANLPYSLPEAISDIIDNSIDAKSKNIIVKVNQVDNEQYLMIKDDGKGIPSDKLEKLMTIGGTRDYAPDDLGAFGVGLKFSSISHSRNLTVFTKVEGKPMNIRRIDLDWMETTDQYDKLLHTDSGSPVVEHIRNEGLLPGENGTTVLLESLTQFDALREGDNSDAHTLVNILPWIENHLAMVFHRFLENPSHPRHFKLLLEGREVTPLNPMAPHEDDPKFGTLVKKSTFTINYEDTDYKVPIQLVILPHQKRHKDREFRNRLTNTVEGSWGETEGAYLYRNDRIVAFSSWFGTVNKQVTTSLRRAVVEISKELDDYFSLSPMKSAYRLPRDFREKFKKAMDVKREWITGEKKVTFHKRADKRYRLEGSGTKGKRTAKTKKGKKTRGTAAKPEPTSEGIHVGKTSEDPSTSVVSGAIVISVFEADAPLISQSTQGGELRTKINMAASSFPLFKDALRRWLKDE